jgi:hypothetical protein
MLSVNYHQNQALSCAAACLCTAALELGRVPVLPAFVNPPVHPAGPVHIPTYYNLFRAALNNPALFPLTPANLGTWEMAIYDISSHGQAWPAEGSRPQGIVKAAICLGMTPEVRIANLTALGTQHPLRYPGEEAACNAVANNANTPHVLRENRTHMGEINLLANQRAMHCMRNNGGTLHWVLQRSDNSYMDPAHGISGNSRAGLKTMGQYQGTGLAIVLS